MTTRKAKRLASKKHYHLHATQRMASATAWKRANRAKWNAYMRRLRARKKAAAAKKKIPEKTD